MPSLLVALRYAERHSFDDVWYEYTPYGHRASRRSLALERRRLPPKRAQVAICAVFLGRAMVRSVPAFGLRSQLQAPERV